MSDKKRVEDAKSAIKDNILEYLDSKGHVINGKVKCIYGHLHKNNDNNPSAGIVPAAPQVCHCFSCGSSFDIFTASHVLEGLPICGPEFFEVTMVTLANRYGIEYDPSDYDEDQRYIEQIRRFYKDVVNYIKLNTPSDIYSYMGSRGYDREVCDELGIGGIDDRQRMRGWLERQGWDKYAINKFGFNDKNLFNTDNVIFPIYDQWSRPIGFVARYMKFEEDRKKRENGEKVRSIRHKYYNSHTSIVYSKARTLYGFQIARKESDKPLYLMEGYIDFLRLYSIGVKNAAAIGGAQFGDNHVRLIEKAGFQKVIYIPDNDPESGIGRNAAINFAKKMRDYKNIKTYILEIPEGFSDVDDYMKDKDPDYLYNHEVKDTLFYYTEYVLDTKSNAEVMESIAEYIVGFNSSVIRSKMISSVCSKYELDQSELSNWVDDKLEDEKMKRSKQIESVRSRMLSKLRNPSLDVREIVDEASTEIKQIESRSTLVLNTPFAESNRILSETIDSYSDPSFNKLYKLKRLPELNEMLDGGIPGDGTWITVGGVPYSGKSSLTRQIAIDLLANTDASVVYFTIDENPGMTVRAMISLLSNVPFAYTYNAIKLDGITVKRDSELPLEEVVNEMRRRIKSGHETIKKWVSNKRFYIQNQNGYSTAGINLALEDIVKESDNVVVIIDSFQQIRYGTNTEIDYNVVAQQLGEIVKSRFNIPMIITSEMNKPASNARPKEEWLSEARKLPHNSDMIILVYNEYKATGKRDKVMPMTNIQDPFIAAISHNKPLDAIIIENIVTKNRLGWGRKGSYHMLQIPWNMRLMPYKIPELFDKETAKENGTNIII